MEHDRYRGDVIVVMLPLTMAAVAFVVFHAHAPSYAAVAAQEAGQIAAQAEELRRSGLQANATTWRHAALVRAPKEATALQTLLLLGDILAGAVAGRAAAGVKHKHKIAFCGGILAEGSAVHCPEHTASTHTA